MAKQGMLGPQIDRFVLVREPWTNYAREGLGSSLGAEESTVRAAVIAGKMELYRVNGESWLVLERMGGMLFIWCFAGRGLVCLIHQLREYARVNGFQQLSFFTFHRGTIRALRRFKPWTYATNVAGETQYCISCEGVAA